MIRLNKFKKLLIISTLATLIGCSVEDSTNKEVGSEFDKICIEGHVYYRYSSVHQYGLSIKLDDNGKPVKCGEIK